MGLQPDDGFVFHQSAPFVMPRGGLFVGVGDLEQFLFAERFRSNRPTGNLGSL